MLDALSEDHDLEQFLESIPGFCDSDVVDDAQYSLNILGRERLANTLVKFWNRTLSSSQPSAVKGRWLIVCMRVLEATDLVTATPRIFRDLASQHMGEVLQSVELGHSLGALSSGKLAPLARSMISGIISNVQEHEDRWFALVMDQLGVSEGVLESYLVHGDSVPLANLIHITRHLFQSLLKGDLDLTRTPLPLLPSVSRFDVLGTLPELQHEFCGLWNEIVQQARMNEGDNDHFVEILAEVRHLYLALHPIDATPTDGSTSHVDVQNQPASYPLCEIADHHSNLTSDAHEVVGNITGVANHDTTTSPILPPPALLHPVQSLV